MTFKTFQEYIDNTKRLLKKQHPKLANDILDEIAPKHFTPNSHSINKHKGILLIHGLLDSATAMSSLYASYCLEGYTVKNILLPGHGTIPEDTLTIHYRQWIDCAQLALNDFNDTVTDITIIGFSAGATLACYLAQHYKKVCRLILFAPAFELVSKGANLIPSLQKFNEFAPWVAKQWLTYETEEEKNKYASITTNSVFQVLSLIKKVQSHTEQRPIHCPIFMIVSTDDETVSYQSAITFLKKQTHTNNQLIIYSNEHKLSDLPKNTEIIHSCLPSHKILNYSHVAMHVAPEHPLYGEKIPHHSHYLGALSMQNKANYKNNLSRLTYNPNYNTLLKKISSFINCEC
tara:strand:- start:221 stop:1258 length:1038 start_codon:yes stop_codon:yes gene_type:complete